MKPFYHLISCSLLLSVSYSCWAYPKKLKLHDGFYVGAVGGYEVYRAKNNISINDNDGDLFSANANSSVTGGVGGIVGGYGYQFHPFYLGGEVFWYATGASSSTNFSASTTPGPETIALTGKQSVKQQYGISMLPGLQVNRSSLVYLRLGITWAKINLNESIRSDGVVIQSGNFNTTQSGFNYGLGMETAIYPKLSVKGEFNHSNYHSFTTPVPFNTQFTFSDNQFLIGLMLHLT